MMRSVLELLHESETKHWWFRARRAITNFVYWKKKHGGLSILSVGCGMGSEFENIRQYGDVTAIDIDREVVERCKTKGLNAVCCDLLQFNSEKKYDVIVMMDVLEHIPDEQKAVAVLYDHLKPGGELLITVPACPFLWSKHDELGEFPHMRRYTYITLKDVLEKAGFEKVKLSYYNFFLLPIAFLVRFFNTSDTCAQEQLKAPPRIINYLLYYIFSFERFILAHGSLPIGVSLLGIFRKPNK